MRTDTGGYWRIGSDLFGVEEVEGSIPSSSTNAMNSPLWSVRSSSGVSNNARAFRAVRATK